MTPESKYDHISIHKESPMQPNNHCNGSNKVKSKEENSNQYPKYHDGDIVKYRQGMMTVTGTITTAAGRAPYIDFGEWHDSIRTKRGKTMHGCIENRVSLYDNKDFEKPTIMKTASALYAQGPRYNEGSNFQSCMEENGRYGCQTEPPAEPCGHTNHSD